MTEADHILQTALARSQARYDATPRIDYDRMNRVFPKQKAALTRAIKSKDPAKVIIACRNVIREWNEIGAWPDDWSRWQRALDDVLPWHQSIQLEDLA